MRGFEGRRALLFAALGLAALAAGMGRKPPAGKAAQEAPMTDVPNLQADDVSPSRWSGSYSGMQEPGSIIATDAGQWQDLWKRAFSKEAPPVDFSKYFAVAVFAGPRNTGGFSVEFLPPEGGGSSIVIPYRIKAPRPGAFVTMSFTQPFAVQLYRRTPLPVRPEERR